jgi:hypothetical protein
MNKITKTPTPLSEELATSEWDGKVFESWPRFPKEMGTSALIQNLAPVLSKGKQRMEKMSLRMKRVRPGGTFSRNGDVDHEMMWTNLPERYTRELMAIRIQVLHLTAARNLYYALSAAPQTSRGHTINQLLRIADRKNNSARDEDDARKSLRNMVPFIELMYATQIDGFWSSPRDDLVPLRLRRALTLLLIAEVVSLELRLWLMSVAAEKLERTVHNTLHSHRYRLNKSCRSQVGRVTQPLESMKPHNPFAVWRF